MSCTLQLRLRNDARRSEDLNNVMEQQEPRGCHGDCIQSNLQTKGENGKNRFKRVNLPDMAEHEQQQLTLCV